MSLGFIEVAPWRNKQFLHASQKPYNAFLCIGFSAAFDENTQVADT